LPVYNKGIWFDGVDDFLTLSGLSLNTSFTIDIWLRPTNSDYIFSTAALALSGLSVTTAFGTLEATTAPTPLQWGLVTVTSSWSTANRTTTLTTAYNNEIAAKQDFLKASIVDSPDNVHYMGAQAVDGEATPTRFFSGFVWSVSIS
jgi:hypothetical protein